MSLDMREVPPGDPPRRPNPSIPIDGADVFVNRSTEEAGIVWIIAPVIACLALSIFFVLFYIVRKLVTFFLIISGSRVACSRIKILVETIVAEGDVLVSL